jgi:hypothetical protein
MSERCSTPSCRQPSKGSIGMLRYCYRCFAELCGWRTNDKRLKQRVTVNLTNDGKDIGLTEWVPDVAISRERERARRQEAV